MSKKKALPRRERKYPQAARCVSTNFPAGIEAIGEKCFVPLADYRELERRYVRLFKRYMRHARKFV